MAGSSNGGGFDKDYNWVYISPNSHNALEQVKKPTQKTQPRKRTKKIPKKTGFLAIIDYITNWNTL